MTSSSFPYRILLVEDDPAVRQMCQILLQAKGYEVICANDGFEGLLALKRSLPNLKRTPYVESYIHKILSQP